MATTRNRRPPAAPAKGGSPQLMALGLLAVIVAGVLGIVLIRGSRNQTDETPPKPAANPFADLPPDLPPGKSAPSASGAGSDAGSSPFGDVSSPLADPLWLGAKRKAEDALGLIKEAVAARNAGDAALALRKGKEAQSLLDEALEATSQWEQDLETRLGPDNSIFKRVQKATSGWRRELMALKKTAGL